MKKTSFIIIFICSCNYPNGTEKTKPNKDDTTNTKQLNNVGNSRAIMADSIQKKNEEKMKKFDYQRYIQQKSGNRAIIPMKDSFQIELYENFDNFIESNHKINCKMGHFKYYSKKTQLLKREGDYFYDYPIGLHKEYNIKGDLVKTIDFDEQYKFSIYDLASKIKKDFKIDIFYPNNERIKVKRRMSSPYMYVVFLPISENNYLEERALTVDSNTGEILSNEIIKTGK